MFYGISLYLLGFNYFIVLESVGYKDILIDLFAMSVSFEEDLNERDASLARKMARIIGVEQDYFLSQVKKRTIVPPEDLFQKTVSSLKELQWNEQILCMAWLCVVANYEGNISEQDWRLIFNIYHKELPLPLREIIKTQNWLTRQIASMN